MKKISEEWLRAAKDDLRVVEKISQDEHLTNMVAFHSQQCIEKSLKAIIEEFDFLMLITKIKVIFIEKIDFRADVYNR